MITTLYILGGLLLLLIVLYQLAPARYEVSRAIDIDRPTTEVFTYLKSLRNQDAWSPWGKRDPNMKQTFTGTDGTVGAVNAWEGNKEVGMGEQEITRIEEGKRIETQLRFLKPWKSQSDAYLEVSPEGSGTRVTWGFKGENVFPWRIMMLFMNMDKMIGKDFEEGLASLKTILEQNN